MFQVSRSFKFILQIIMTNGNEEIVTNGDQPGQQPEHAAGSQGRRTTEDYQWRTHNEQGSKLNPFLPAFPFPSKSSGARQSGFTTKLWNMEQCVSIKDLEIQKSDILITLAKLISMFLDHKCLCTISFECMYTSPLSKVVVGEIDNKVVVEGSRLLYYITYMFPHSTYSINIWRNTISIWRVVKYLTMLQWESLR